LDLVGGGRHVRRGVVVRVEHLLPDGHDVDAGVPGGAGGFPQLLLVRVGLWLRGLRFRGRPAPLGEPRERRPAVDPLALVEAARLPPEPAAHRGHPRVAGVAVRVPLPPDDDGLDVRPLRPLGVARRGRPSLAQVLLGQDAPPHERLPDLLARALEKIVAVGAVVPPVTLGHQLELVGRELREGLQQRRPRADGGADARDQPAPGEQAGAVVLVRPDPPGPHPGDAHRVVEEAGVAVGLRGVHELVAEQGDVGLAVGPAALLLADPLQRSQVPVDQFGPEPRHQGRRRLALGHLGHGGRLPGPVDGPEDGAQHVAGAPLVFQQPLRHSLEVLSWHAGKVAVGLLVTFADVVSDNRWPIFPFPAGEAFLIFGLPLHQGRWTGAFPVNLFRKIFIDNNSRRAKRAGGAA